MNLLTPDFSAVRVLVAGDLMLDRYWHGGTSRISPEAPVPVVHINQSEDRPGGAGNVALNIASLGAKVSVLGFTGDDEAADILQERLAAAGVDCHFTRISGAPTITKLRVLSRHQQLIRLDFEESFAQADYAALEQRFSTLLAQADAVILSDYGKGALRHATTLIRAARAAGKPVLVDPKGTDFGIYRGATLITPNLSEFEAVVGKCRDEQELVRKGGALAHDCQLDALLVTRGEHGMTLLREGQQELHFPAQAREVFDVTGAGDTVISVLAACLGAGVSLAEATELANLAAGIVVGKLGTATVSSSELRRALQTGHKAGTGVVNEEQLMVMAADARAHGERIVMTNGCFDILHAGHVAYLEQARRIGDRLIVAVNDDESVRRLKGKGRPVNSVERRMAVLAALGCVDWVVPFSEDTPERLICRVTPDLLVKGGDYRPQDIAGYACVTGAGGEVRVLGFEPGCSTSEIIRLIQEM
jgi:D-beta-D-heptose 7-phosphate kinase/D-beta-D-heptose 1-phosphate adenosyltransferase